MQTMAKWRYLHPFNTEKQTNKLGKRKRQNHEVAGTWTPHITKIPEWLLRSAMGRKALIGTGRH